MPVRNNNMSLFLGVKSFFFIDLYLQCWLVSAIKVGIFFRLMFSKDYFIARYFTGSKRKQKRCKSLFKFIVGEIYNTQGASFVILKMQITF